VNSNLSKLESQIKEAFAEEQLRKLRITKARQQDVSVKEIVIRPVQLKKGLQLQFVYKEAHRDITKNYPIDAAWEGIALHMKADFKFLSAVTIDKVYQYDAIKDRLSSTKNAQSKKPQFDHDKQKRKAIDSSAIFLKELGVTSTNGKVKADKQAKFRQINRYIEIMAPIMEAIDLPKNFTVVDMGSGKGYLTFALYQHLLNLGLKAKVKGIELRSKLVEQCNAVAQACNYDDLSFTTGEISSARSEKMDLLIALHACDTATDDAIIAGVKNQAQLIVCSPCCHKQVRKDMNTTGSLGSITQYGILKERQAELLTDTIRVLLLNYCGYKTKVIEFVSSEHTPKNLLLIGMKDGRKADPLILETVAELKSQFGLQQHYLEKLLIKREDKK